MKDGKGIFTWPDGRKYDGQWSKGKQHGRAKSARITRSVGSKSSTGACFPKFCRDLTNFSMIDVMDSTSGVSNLPRNSNCIEM